MRALTVIAEMGTGGAESMAADLAHHLLDLGDQVCIASNGGWRTVALADAGATTLAVPLRSRGPVQFSRTVARLRRETAARPVDIVHAHNVRASLAAHLGTRGGRRVAPPLVTTVHGLAAGDYRRAVPVLAASDLVVAVSDDVATRLTAAGLDPASLRVVENAVPAPRSEPGVRDAVRRELGLSEAGPVVLCAARLAPPKRVDLLLEAWAQVPGATLLVAGDGPERDALERQAGPMLTRVRFLGTRHDVDRLLCAVDLLVLPSDREGLSMVVLEALAAGVPVVASAVGGVAGLGGAVELVAPHRAEPLAAGIRGLLQDPARRRTMGQHGRSLVEGRFSAPRMRSEYAAAYARARRGRTV